MFSNYCMIYLIMQCNIKIYRDCENGKNWRWSESPEPIKRNMSKHKSSRTHDDDRSSRRNIKNKKRKRSKSRSHSKDRYSSRKKSRRNHKEK